MNIMSKKAQKVVGIALIVCLALFVVWDGVNQWSAGGVCAGVSLLLVIGAMLYLNRLANVTERNITRRIETEFPPETRAQVFESYQHLKIKELEGLFGKILDDAKGDAYAVQRLAGVAEGVGYQAFLENHW